MNIIDKIKIFRFSHEMIESDLNEIETKYQLKLRPENELIKDKDEKYYPQFDESIRNEAREMSLHYELFYCLEKSIRKLISEKMKAEHGAMWWDKKVPQEINKNAEENIKKEQEAGVSPRSSEKIDYINFGDLKVIVDSNWETFSDTFNNQKAFGKVMAVLNLLRSPIAHCSNLADDEIDRLELAIKDWFRLME